MRLEIGGLRKRNGWTTLDIAEEVKPDVVDDCRYLKSITDESCEEILCSHVLEHIHEYDILETITNWRKKLTVAGKITVYVPDMVEAFEQYRTSKISGDTLLVVMIGSKSDEQYLLHRTFFWFSRLEKIFYQAGLRNIVQLQSRGDRIEFGIQARKTKNNKYFTDLEEK